MHTQTFIMALYGIHAFGSVSLLLFLASIVRRINNESQEDSQS